MANLVSWDFTQLPTDIIEILEKDIKQFDSSIGQSGLMGDNINLNIRDSKNAWISTSHWIGGWLWYYVSKMNRQNFLYDIVDVDGGTLQYTHYGEGQFYNWHQDSDIDTHYRPQQIYSSDENKAQDLTIQAGEYVRKLSFALQLSDPSDYRGGEVEFLDNNNNKFLAPKQKGTMIVFDSRVRHRVRKIKSGMRKSIVGWVVGPRWK